MEVLLTPTCAKQLKKLHKNQKMELDEAIRAIIQDPCCGEMKKGDLSGVRVYKFRMTNQLMLLAYTVDESGLKLILLACGPHENFYRNLKA